MDNKKVIIIYIMISILLISCGKGDNIEPINKSDFLMDTVVKISVYDSEDEDILNKVYGRLFEIENRMSRTMKVSDVSKINVYAGKEVATINKDTWSVIKLAMEYAERTDGIFEPSIGVLSKLWDINSSDKDRDWIPSKEHIESALERVNYEKIALLDDNKVKLEEEGMELDLGAIVKGYATDEAKDIILKNGATSAIVDLGGNVYAVGEKPNGDPWKIGIREPDANEGNHLGIISVRDKSIVTSGDYERYFEIEGVRYHHILDPRTGYPVNNELSSVTIISDESIIGDIMSTTAFILGLEEGMEMVNGLDEVEAVFITKDKEIHLTAGAKDMFELKDSKDKYKIMK